MIPVFFNRKMLNDPTDLIYFISSCIDRWVILQKKKQVRKMVEEGSKILRKVGK
jgi:hypothetical protein